MRPNLLIRVPAKIEFAAKFNILLSCNWRKKLKSILNMRSKCLKPVVVVPYVLRQ